MHTPSDEPSSALIDALAGEGELVDDGQFTLDFARARAKLADYRLGDPLGFVLLLVEAAHLLPGCSGLDFELSSTELRARFQGARLSPRELETLFDSALGGASEDPSREARRLLAIASSVALAHEDGELELAHSGPEGARALVLNADGSVDLRRDATPQRVARLQWRLQRSTSLLERIGDELPAQLRALLHARCHHARVPLRIDGASLNWTLSGPPIPAALASVELREGDTVRGAAGWTCLSPDAHIELLANGVLIETRPRPKWTRGFVAVVEAGELPRDLSLSSFVDDARLDARLALAERAHASFEFSALVMPLVLGRPRVNALELALSSVGLLIAASMFMYSQMLDLEGRVELIIPVVLAGMLVFGISTYYFMRNISKLEQGTKPKPDAKPYPNHLPGVAQTLDAPELLASRGSVREVEVPARVYTRESVPLVRELRLTLTPDQLELLQPGAWLWVRLDPRSGDLSYDAHAESDRPQQPGALFSS